MSAHSSVVGGSSASRVANCPASIKLSAQMPPSPSSPYANHGTAMHYVMEQYLLAEDPEHFNPWKYVGLEVSEHKIEKADIIECVLPAIEATEQAFKRFDIADYEPELTVHYQSIPGAFGTCDLIGRTADDRLVVLDFKFGSGVLVSPVENRQLMFYAGAVLEDPGTDDFTVGVNDDTEVVLAIVQPAQESPLNAWTTTAAHVRQFVDQLGVSVQVGTTKTADPNPGDWCRWCPAAPVCPAKLDKADHVVHMREELLEDLTEALSYVDELETWIKQVRTLAHQQLERGDSIEGWKLVKKRPMRKWIDEEAMFKLLSGSRRFKRDEYTTSKMVTPPQFEKLCKSKSVDFKDYAEHITAVSSGTTLAPADDPREGVVLSHEREIPEHFAKQMRLQKR